jgi:hypothetical protein
MPEAIAQFGDPYRAHNDRIAQLEAEVSRLRAELNTPHTADFLDAVRIEAAHQRERWGNAHDAGKADADWFWLVGYLAGKAIQPSVDLEKKLHRVIATAAALLNWHAAASGTDTRMRPGIEPPALPACSCSGSGKSDDPCPEHEA